MATQNCLVCGRKFTPCNTCHKGDINYAWRKVVCCREHFYYHMPIIQYVRKQISKEDAKAQLSQAIKSFGKVEFVDNIKGVVDEIMAESEKKNKKSKIEPKVEIEQPVEVGVADDFSETNF